MFVELPGIVRPEEWPISNATGPGWSATWPGWECHVAWLERCAANRKCRPSLERNFVSVVLPHDWCDHIWTRAGRA